METPNFVDGIGRRVRTVDSTGQEVETLHLCRELSEVSSTEAALVERAGRLTGFVHPCFSQIVRVERVRGALGGLSIVSTAVPGVRLSDLLALAQRKWLAPDPGASLYILEQVASALAAFHRYSRECSQGTLGTERMAVRPDGHRYSTELSHGALGPERIVIRPDGHPTIVEHVLSPALGCLQMGRGALWTQFRVPVPAVAGSARFDQMTDIMQLGMLALAVVLGRPVGREEYPQKLQELLHEATTPGALGNRPVVSRALYGWVLRTLQLESRSSFRTAADASAALEAIVAEQPRHRVSAAAVVAYVAACTAPGDGKPASSTGSTLYGPPVAAGLAAPPRALDRQDASASMTTRVASRGGQSAAEPAASGSALVTRRGLATSHTRPQPQRRSRLAGVSVRRVVRVSLVASVLVALFGVTYLGARGYLGLHDLVGGRGTLFVESHPTGADLYVDGRPSGKTPATLELKAGEHTLSLRAGKGTTFVPVVVVAGARRVERVEIRQPRRTRQ